MPGTFFTLTSSRAERDSEKSIQAHYPRGDESILDRLDRLAELDIVPGDPVDGPAQHRSAGQLRAVVADGPTIHRCRRIFRTSRNRAEREERGSQTAPLRHPLSPPPPSWRWRPPLFSRYSKKCCAMWPSTSSIDGRSVKEIVENRHRRFRSQRLRRQGPATDRDLDIIRAAPVRVAQNFVGLVDFTEAFGIRTLAQVGMHCERDPAIRPRLISPGAA